MHDPLVTIITPTTGAAFLKDAVESVRKQTYKNIQHLIVVDGKHHTHKTESILQGDEDIIVLPYATGTNNFLGHKIYGGATFFAKGEFVCFLDEDNWMDQDHIASLIDVTENNAWGYSLRKITDDKNNFICNDDCESLGLWKSILNDHFVDVNCFMIKKTLALGFSSGWYRRARIDKPEVDRLLTKWLLSNHPSANNCSGKYTINYRSGNRTDSVQSSFFKKGNAVMSQKYNNDFPWRK